MEDDFKIHKRSISDRPQDLADISRILRSVKNPPTCIKMIGAFRRKDTPFDSEMNAVVLYLNRGDTAAAQALINVVFNKIYAKVKGPAMMMHRLDTELPSDVLGIFDQFLKL